MLDRMEYRCCFRNDVSAEQIKEDERKVQEKVAALIREGKMVNVSFYRHKQMGFLYVERLDQTLIPEDFMKDLERDLRVWPEEEKDTPWAPMYRVYYHHIPEEDLDEWEKERTTAVKTRIGRIAFVYPEKVASYMRYHDEIVTEGLLKGDKYQYISLHENILFSYYEEPRNNMNLRGVDEPSKVIDEYMASDPESHFDRVKAQGDNFLVLPAEFSVDRIDLK